MEQDSLTAVPSRALSESFNFERWKVLWQIWLLTGLRHVLLSKPVARYITGIEIWHKHSLGEESVSQATHHHKKWNPLSTHGWQHHPAGAAIDEWMYLAHDGGITLLTKSTMNFTFNLSRLSLTINHNWLLPPFMNDLRCFKFVKSRYLAATHRTIYSELSPFALLVWGEFPTLQIWPPYEWSEREQTDEAHDRETVRHWHLWGMKLNLLQSGVGGC